MSYLVLARKYRPQTFEAVVGQEHVTRTLANAIQSDRVAHAIIFSGPRGTGKTTIARILAKAMNCENGPTATPCNQCRSCADITNGSGADVFEIDGASNNSVDQVRELRENIRYMPSHSRYKIYIIDEVHMLSIAAFNALLKTLEEPPSHVLFLFATTELHKIPITILSRCQQHDLRRAGIEAISSHLKMIGEKEGVELPSESIWMIAREASGSIRDALSLLDQVFSCMDGPISHQQLFDIMGVIDRKIVHDITQAILSGDVSAVLAIIDDVFNRGHDIRKLYLEVLTHFRHLSVIKLSKASEKIVDLPQHEIESMQKQVENLSDVYLVQLLDALFQDGGTIRHAEQPRLALEMVFIRLFQTRPVLSIDTLIDKVDALRHRVSELPALPAGPVSTGDGLSGGHGDIPASGPESRVEKSAASSRAEIIREEVHPAPPAPSPEPPSVDAAPPPTPDPAPQETIPSENAPVSINALGKDRFWDILIADISKSKPSIAAMLKKCHLKTADDATVEIEVTAGEYVAKTVEKQMPVIKAACRRLVGRPIEVSLSRNMEKDIEKEKNKSEANQMKMEVVNHPLVADAIDIFNGKVVDIKNL